MPSSWQERVGKCRIYDQEQYAQRLRSPIPCAANDQHDASGAEEQHVQADAPWEVGRRDTRPTRDPAHECQRELAARNRGDTDRKEVECSSAAIVIVLDSRPAGFADRRDDAKTMEQCRIDGIGFCTASRPVDGHSIRDRVGKRRAQVVIGHRAFRRRAEEARVE